MENGRLTYPGSLHNHTDYSNERLRDAISTIESLADTAISLGHSVLAYTEHDTLSGYVKIEGLYKSIKEQHPDFKIIRGNEIYLCRNGLNNENFNREKDRYFHFILLCKDLEGYHQLCELSTRAYERSYIAGRQRRVPTYYQDLMEVVKPNNGHLIASSACLGSFYDNCLLKYRETNDGHYLDMAKRWALYIQDIFGKGNFYLEMQPSNNEEQIFVNKHIVEMSQELSIPYIITTDSHYCKKEDAPVHKAFLNAQEGEREVDSFYATTYLMGDEEIRSFFSYLTEEQLQYAYRNILEIREKCEDFSIQKPLKIPSLLWRQFHHYDDNERQFYYEQMPSLKKFADSEHEADRVLVDAVIEGIKGKNDLQNEAAYKALEECLDMTWVSSEVNKAQWSAYYLNLQRIIDECWNAGSITLPSRGSGGGFLLLYALDIIQMNKLRENTELYPWRFLNPARVSVLDIDTDISGMKRAQVLNHLSNVYKDRMCNVATFKLEKSKSAILTASRGLGISVDDAQYISSLITVERGQCYTLKQMYYGDEENGIEPNKMFIDAVNRFENLWNVANKIEGLICGVGVHAGGVVFVDEPFTNTCALMRAPDGTLISQFELHDLENLSLIKYDMLSVEAADKIQTCLELLIEQGYIEQKSTLRETYMSVLNPYVIERTDHKMWEMVWNHDIVSLFQMEKQSGIQGIALTKPENVDELATLNSVIRLMSQEKGGETPLEKYTRFREHKDAFEKEMIENGLTEEERRILHKQLDISSGLCITQEG